MVSKDIGIGLCIYFYIIPTLFGYFLACTLLRLAVFRVAFGQLCESC